jgi:hypothetical protein
MNDYGRIGNITPADSGELDKFIRELVPALERERRIQGLVPPAQPVELAALQSHESPDGHHWRSALAREEFRFIEGSTIPLGVIAIYALCPCGATRRFEVKP